MSKFCYLIRQNNFAYNDEYFLTGLDNPPVLGRIESFYGDKEQAIQQWKMLIVDALRHEPIDSFDVFTGEGDMSLEKAQTIRHELQAQYGINLFLTDLVQPVISITDISQKNQLKVSHALQMDIFGNHQALNDRELIQQLNADQSTHHSTTTPDSNLEAYIDHDIFCQLDDESIFIFAEYTGLLPYQLIEYPLEQSIYVIWLCHEQQYLTNADDGSILFGTQVDFMQQLDQQENGYSNATWYFQKNWSESDQLKGQLDQLVHSIDLFHDIFKNNEYIKYVSVNQQLNTKLNSPFTDLNILNELLQHPIYEIRKINLETLQNLTQEQQR